MQDRLELEQEYSLAVGRPPNPYLLHFLASTRGSSVKRCVRGRACVCCAELRNSAAARGNGAGAEQVQEKSLLRRLQWPSIGVERKRERAHARLRLRHGGKIQIKSSDFPGAAKSYPPTRVQPCGTCQCMATESTIARELGEGRERATRAGAWRFTFSRNSDLVPGEIKLQQSGCRPWLWNWGYSLVLRCTAEHATARAQVLRQALANEVHGLVVGVGAHEEPGRTPGARLCPHRHGARAPGAPLLPNSALARACPCVESLTVLQQLLLISFHATPPASCLPHDLHPIPVQPGRLLIAPVP